MFRIAMTGALVCAAMSGCHSASNSEEANAYCHTVPRNGISCQGCVQVTENDRAFDGSFGSAATMGAGGQGSFQAATERQPGGRVAGVYFTLPSSSGVSVTITTLLNGVQQDVSGGPATRQNGVDTCNLNMDCSFHDGGGSWVGMNTTKDYDQIRVSISNSAADAMAINEICVR